MGKKKIFTIGFELPGDTFEQVSYDSDQSLLDADIVLYKVGFGTYPTEDYQGKPLFNHYYSARIADQLQHWRSELASATNAGKLVIIFLSSPRSYYRYTGEQQFSGTGRSRVTTNIVTSVSSYGAVPNITSAEAKSGREVRLTREGNYLAPYWNEFGSDSPYEAFIEGKFTHKILTTKTGDKTVGAAVLGKGSLLFLPPLGFDEDEFTEFDNESEEIVWTDEAVRFGNRLAASLANLWDVLRRGRMVTPPPEWTLDSAFATDEEASYRSLIVEVSEQVNELQKRRAELEEQLNEAGAIRALLYEQGGPLERAVRNALTMLGFSVSTFAEGDSEFDVIFESEEGRLLGEVEGKDSRAVNIEKFSQLERNLQEDFARDGVTEYAKGVLFGNSERFKPLPARGEAFTAKCFTAAKRVHVALVRTADLFESVRYLRSHPDPGYAKECRLSILKADGELVVFPTPPFTTNSTLREEEAKAVELGNSDEVDVSCEKAG